MSQQILTGRQEELELTVEDLRSLEQLSFESTGEVAESQSISEIAEQRRMAIVLLSAEISAHRPDYVFSVDSGDHMVEARHYTQWATVN